MVSFGLFSPCASSRRPSKPGECRAIPGLHSTVIWLFSTPCLLWGQDRRCRPWAVCRCSGRCPSWVPHRQW